MFLLWAAGWLAAVGGRDAQACPMPQPAQSSAASFVQTLPPGCGGHFFIFKFRLHFILTPSFLIINTTSNSKVNVGSMVSLWNQEMIKLIFYVLRLLLIICVLETLI